MNNTLEVLHLNRGSEIEINTVRKRKLGYADFTCK